MVRCMSILTGQSVNSLEYSNWKIYNYHPPGEVQEDSDKSIQGDDD